MLRIEDGVANISPSLVVVCGVVVAVGILLLGELGIGFCCEAVVGEVNIGAVGPDVDETLVNSDGIDDVKGVDDGGGVRLIGIGDIICSGLKLENRTVLSLLLFFRSITFILSEIDASFATNVWYGSLSSQSLRINLVPV